MWIHYKKKRFGGIHSIRLCPKKKVSPTGLELYYRLVVVFILPCFALKVRQLLEISLFSPSADTNILHRVPAKALPKVGPLQNCASCVHFRKRINQPSSLFKPCECDSLLSLVVVVSRQEPVPCCQPTTHTALPVVYMDELNSVVISSVQLPSSCGCAHSGSSSQQWSITHPARNACEPPGIHTKQYTVYKKYVTNRFTFLLCAFCCWNFLMFLL